MGSELIIKINGDATQLSGEFDRIKDETQELEDQLGSIAKFSALAFAALTAEVAVSVRAFAESEHATKSLGQAIRNQGLDAEVLVKQYKAQADALQFLTGIDDDVIVSGQALLQGMIGQTEISKELTAAVLDLSAAQEIDLESAFALVGKAVEGNVGALGRYGIKIDENLTKSERMAAITATLNQKFSGQAEAANQGVGSIKGLATAFGNLQEAIGAQFAPAIESASKKLTEFFQWVTNKPGMAGFIADNIKLGLVITGIATVVASSALGFIKLRQAIELSTFAMKLFGTSTKAALITSGIGIAVIALTEAILYFSNKAASGHEGAAKSAGEHTAAIKQLKAEIKALDEANSREPSGEFKKYNDRKIASLRERLAEEEKLQADADAKQNKDKSDEKSRGNAASKAAAEQRKAEQERLAEVKAGNELIALEQSGASDKELALQKEKIEIQKKLADENYKGDKAALRSRLEDISAIQAEFYTFTEEELRVRAETKRQIEIQNHELDKEQKRVFREEILANDAEYQALSEEEKAIYRQRQEAELAKEIETEKTTRDKAMSERQRQQIETNNRYLADQQKFGTAYAEINRVMHSEIYKGSKQAFGELTQLQQSENSKLKAIGKAAAIASIIIRTAESAMNIYAGFSTIPIVGPVLGIAGAAAAVAFGAEQLGKVNAMADGGMVSGGVRGQDSVAAMLMPGELVVPKNNFEEVVGSVQSGRAGGSQAGSTEMLDVLRSIEAKLDRVQPSQTFIQGDIVQNDSFIDAMVRQISEAVEFRNARLVTSPAGVS